MKSSIGQGNICIYHLNRKEHFYSQHLYIFLVFEHAVSLLRVRMGLIRYLTVSLVP